MISHLLAYLACLNLPEAETDGRFWDTARNHLDVSELLNLNRGSMEVRVNNQSAEQQPPSNRLPMQPREAHLSQTSKPKRCLALF